MAAKKNLLFVSSECQPFAVTGGLAEVIGSLPKAIMAERKSYKVSVVMPLYSRIIKNYGDKLKFIGQKTITLAWRNLYAGVFKTTVDGVDYYFIDNKYYFDREGLYGYFDDGERFCFFSKAVIECFPIFGFVPEVVHAHDWHAAATNIFLDILYKKNAQYMDIKTVFTIHNIEYQGIYEPSFLEYVMGIDRQYMEILDYNGLVNLMKGAIVCSDLVTTVSPRYAREITTAQYAHGLEHIIRLNNQKLVGIINGINYELYNPETNEVLPNNFNSESLNKKKANKLALQRGLNLELDENVCIISMITRLAGHKGIDLILDKFDQIMQENVQFIVLGTGESFYENKFREFARRYPKRVASMITFNGDLSKQIYGASDLFLMPSKTEPCGLSQMIASRYGTAPIVRATGGLYDTIKDYNGGDGNGFVFKDYDSQKMLEKIQEAVRVYYSDDYEALAKKIMDIDFSWNASANLYIKQYAKLLKKKK